MPSMGYGRVALVLLALVAALVWFLPSYYTGLLTQIGLYALVTIGLNLFMGYAGQVSLGQAAFFGIGAYTSAALAVKWALTPWAGMVAGAILAALVAYVLSFVALRLRENLLALATLALGIVINVVFNQWEFIGGSSGFKDIPGFALGAYTFDQRAYAILAWALVAVGLWFAGNVVRSSFGRSLIAISAGELGAQALGVDARAPEAADVRAERGVRRRRGRGVRVAGFVHRPELVRLLALGELRADVGHRRHPQPVGGGDRRGGRRRAAAAFADDRSARAAERAR